MAKKKNVRMQEFADVGGRGKYPMSVGLGRSAEAVHAMMKEYWDTGKIDEIKWARK